MSYGRNLGKCDDCKANVLAGQPHRRWCKVARVEALIADRDAYAAACKERCQERNEAISDRDAWHEAARKNGDLAVELAGERDQARAALEASQERLRVLREAAEVLVEVCEDHFYCDCESCEDETDKVQAAIEKIRAPEPKP